MKKLKSFDKSTVQDFERNFLHRTTKKGRFSLVRDIICSCIAVGLKSFSIYLKICFRKLSREIKWPCVLFCMPRFIMIWSSAFQFFSSILQQKNSRKICFHCSKQYKKITKYFSLPNRFEITCNVTISDGPLNAACISLLRNAASFLWVCITPYHIWASIHFFIRNCFIRNSPFRSPKIKKLQYWESMT